MPNHHCCVPGCSADSRKDTSRDKYRFLKGVTFHPFPRDPETRDLWLSLIRRQDNYVPNRYSRVCSLHFEGKKGPTAANPCPTIFNYNSFSGKIPEELEPQVKQVVSRAQQQASLRVTSETRMSDMMELAAQKRARQEQLNRVQAEIMAKAQANAALLASINEAEKAGQIQLIDEADIKAIQEAADAEAAGNPYRFINENTDLMWRIGALAGESKGSTTAQGGAMRVVTTVAGNGTATNGGKKRKQEEMEGGEDEEEEEEEEEDGEEEESTSDDEESEESEGKEKEATEVVVKEAALPEGITAVAVDPETLEEELNEEILRPPLIYESQEVNQLRQRLTLRGPHHNFLPKPRCKFCNLFFQSIDSLLGHLYRHTDRPYQCVECGATFRKAEEMEVHLDVHQHREVEMGHYYRVRGTKHGILECPVEGCSWHSWGGIRVFAAHIRQHNKGCCVLCGEGMHGSSEPYFMKHIKKHMSFITSMKCPLCPPDNQAIQRKFLDNHVKQEHSANLKPWACYHCDNHKVIPRFCDLDLHLLKQHSSNPYECQYCGAAYPSLYGLKCHARKHHKRGKEHDTKYEWVEVVHGQKVTKETRLPSTRKSQSRQKVNMMPQTGDRQMQQNPQDSTSSLMSLFAGAASTGTKLNIQQMAAQVAAQVTGTPMSLPMTVPKNIPVPITVPKPSPTKTATSTTARPSPGPSPGQQQKVVMRRYKPQKVRIVQKDGSTVEKTLLLPIDEPQLATSTAQPKGTASPVGPGKSQPTALGPTRVATRNQQGSPANKPTSTVSRPPSSQDQATASTSASPQQLSLEDIASGNIPGVDLDGAILESLGISSQDLELGQVTETDQSLGFTITEVRGDIDFGALPDDGQNIGEEGAEQAGVSVAPSLQEDKDDKTLMKVRCPYKACTETYDTAVGFWRRHYLKLHFKRSDLYEFMCRDCGELFANWDWPPDGHDCNEPRWACICADCGDVFENQKYKHAHFPDCLTFQKYTPAKAATVITATTCLYCHTNHKSVADLCNHLRVAHVSRRFNSLAIYCSQCPDYPSFPKPEALWSHYKAEHLDWWRKQPIWVCTKCGETLETEYDLTKHVVYTHADDVAPSFLCGKCPYVFGQKALFDMHRQIAHKD